jgi:membrane protease YdiL (CAAX protease family)
MTSEPSNPKNYAPSSPLWKKIIHAVREVVIQFKANPALLILLLTPILLTLWVYFGKHNTLPQTLFPSGGDIAAVWYEYLAAFLLMFALPALLLWLFYRLSPRRLGVRLGDWRQGLIWLGIGTPFMLLAAYAGSLDPAMQAEYPQAHSVLGNLPLLLGMEVGYLIYYFAWEFLFRGCLFFGLEKQYGALAAVLIQTIPSSIVHIGKPFNESFSAIFAGLFFGFVAYRTRSIFYPMILHAIVGIGVDIFIVLRMAA